MKQKKRKEKKTKQQNKYQQNKLKFHHQNISINFANETWCENAINWKIFDPDSTVQNPMQNKYSLSSPMPIWN